MKKILVILIIAALAGESFAQGLLRRNNTLLNNRVSNSNPAPAAETGATPTTSQKTSDPGASKVDVGGRSIEFNGAALDIVLMVYGNLVGKTVLKDPQAPAATITLQPKQGQDLTDEDKILAIETVLEMNGIHLEPYGEKFVRALPRSNVRKDGIPLIMDPDAELGESTKVVSLMLTFRNIALDEAQKALEGLKSDKGVLNVFERTSSILVTDTEMNINRMREIAKTIDVPTPVTENVFIRQIKNAAAQDIKTALEAIVQESQKELEKQGQKANQVQRNTTQPTPPRTLLGRNNQQNQPPAPTANESLVTSVSDADRGMIRGKVLILSDERSNKLIIVTSKANMDFFDKVIEQLDIETTPDTVVKVYRLKYADSEDVSDMINDLIGNAASSKSSSKGSQNANSKNASTTKVNTTTGSSTTAKTPANQRTGEAKAGELSKENTTILADKRINGLVVMTNKELVPVIEQIIESMDIKLAQVLIETVIIEVTLTDEISTGIDWVSKIKDNGNQALSGGGGTGSATTVPQKDGPKILATDAITMVPQGAGTGYFAHIKDLNLSAVVSASKTDSKSKYLASPVVMTVDNKEATIDATTKRQFITNWQSTSSGNWGSGMPTPTYSAEDIGIKLKVTPKINPNGSVMLQVEEEYTQVVSKQVMLVPNDKTYEPKEVEVPTSRKMSSDVILEHQQTIVFGGLVETKVTKSDSGIPLLKDIPYVGRYLFGKTEDSESRTELLVFMTPYVLDDAVDAQQEAIRRKKVLSDARAWDDGGWSRSELADPVSQREQLRRQTEEWEKQDEEHAAALAIEKAKLDRAVELGQRAIDEKKQKESEDAARAEREAEIREENASLLEELKTE